MFGRRLSSGFLGLYRLGGRAWAKAFSLLAAHAFASFGTRTVLQPPIRLAALFYEPGNDAGDHPGCDWFTTPPEPGTGAAARAERQAAADARRFRRSEEADTLRRRLHSLSTVAERR